MEREWNRVSGWLQGVRTAAEAGRLGWPRLPALVCQSSASFGSGMCLRFTEMPARSSVKLNAGMALLASFEAIDRSFSEPLKDGP